MRPLLKSLCLIVALHAAFLVGGCNLFKRTPPAPPPAEVKTAPALATALGAQDSKAAAAVGAAIEANSHNAEGPAKTATAGELSVASANLPTPSDKDRAEALARVNAALKGDLEFANREWAKARDAAGALQSQIDALQQQVKNERIAAAAELQRQLSAARDEAKREADAQQRKIAAWIFYGGAFLLGVAAVVVFGTASYVPMFGPRLAFMLAGAAAVSGMLGAMVNDLLANPWIVRTLFGALIAAIAVAGGIAYTNHHHHVTSGATEAKPPASQ